LEIKVLTVQVLTVKVSTVQFSIVAKFFRCVNTMNREPLHLV